MLSLVSVLQTDRQRERQRDRDRQTDRQADRDTERDRERETHTHTQGKLWADLPGANYGILRVEARGVLLPLVMFFAVYKILACSSSSGDAVTEVTWHLALLSGAKQC